MSVDKYLCIFSHQMAAIVFINLQIFFATRAIFKIGECSRIFSSFSWGIVGHLTCLDQSRASEKIWWIITLGYFLVQLCYTQSRDVFRPIRSMYWYFFARQVHPTTGRISQTRLECFVSQGLKLTRLVRISCELHLLRLMQKHRTDFLSRLCNVFMY